MNGKFWIVGAALLLVGCSASGSSPAARRGSETTSQPTECASATQACYCPDGTLSGMQSCDAGRLSSCTCPVTVAGVAPVPGDPTRVCAELQSEGACSAVSYASEEVPSSILFVLDRSGSMACNPPPVQTVADCNADPTRADPNQPSRWEITVKALNDAFAALSTSAATIGLSLFNTDDYCGVDSAPTVELGPPTAVQLTALSEALSASSPAGGTPIVGAVITGYHHLHEELHAPGNRYVVLITDGEESCGTKGDEADKADLDAARTLLLGTEVQKAREANIKTFVIGAPGSEGARGFLSELAYLGGTARSPNCVHGSADTGDCHFDLTTESDFATVLRDALGQISGKALGCEFRTPLGSTGSLVNVQYSQNGGAPTCFAQDLAACDGGANGWQFAKDSFGNDDPTRVVLCGAACETVKADPTTVVDVVLGCPIVK
jgi:hypothetical protein